MTDLELVAQLEGADPQERHAAAAALLTNGRGYKTDRHLAERIVKAAENERSGELPPGELRECWLPHRLGEVVAAIELAPTGLGPRVRALMADHPLIDLRLGIIRYVLSSNLDAEVFEALKALVEDPHSAVRARALDALQMDLAFPGEWHAGLFQLFVDKLGDPDPEVASHALQNLGGWINLRPDLFDVYLTFVEALVRRGETVPYRCIWGVARLLDADSETTPEQVTRAVAVAEAIALNPNNGSDRQLVLRGISERGGVEGGKLLEQLKKDPDIGAEARSLLKRARTARARG